MHDLWHDTPNAYARRLCYISDASTIYARTMNEFGRSPSMEWIKKAQKERASSGRSRNVGDAIAPPMARKAYTPPAEKPIFASDVITQVAGMFGFTLADMLGTRGVKRINQVRNLACQLLYVRAVARGDGDKCLTQIARWMNRKDHSSIGYILLQFNKMREDGEMMSAYRRFLDCWSLRDVTYARVAKPKRG